MTGADQVAAPTCIRSLFTVAWSDSHPEGIETNPLFRTKHGICAITVVDDNTTMRRCNVGRKSVHMTRSSDRGHSRTKVVGIMSFPQAMAWQL